MMESVRQDFRGELDTVREKFGVEVALHEIDRLILDQLSINKGFTDQGRAIPSWHQAGLDFLEDEKARMIGVDIL